MSNIFILLQLGLDFKEFKGLKSELKVLVQYCLFDSCIYVEKFITVADSIFFYSDHFANSDPLPDTT